MGHLRRKPALESGAHPAKACEMDGRIKACDRDIESLVRGRQAADQYVRAGQRSESEKPQASPRPLRLLLDTLCMIAYRAETATAAAPELDNPDTARSLLKSLFRGDASLHIDGAAGTLTVRLLHQPTRAQDLALAPLLDELNRTSTVIPGAQLQLVDKRLSEDESCPTASQAGPDGPQTRHPK